MRENEQIKQLQNQPSVFWWYSDNSTHLNILLPEIKNKLVKLQTKIIKISKIDILRAGKRWMWEQLKISQIAQVKHNQNYTSRNCYGMLRY